MSHLQFSNIHSVLDLFRIASFSPRSNLYFYGIAFKAGKCVSHKNRELKQYKTSKGLIHLKENYNKAFGGNAIY